MIRQDYIIWSVGVGLSLTLHASLLIQSGAQLGVESANEGAKPLITRLNFYQQPSVSTERVEKIEVVKAKKIATKKATMPVVKKIVKVLEPVKIDKQKVDEQLVQATPQRQGQLANNKPALFLNEKKAYMQQLLAHIENKKFYPRSARSRGIEGDIHVSFELMADGSIRKLNVGGGHSVLLRATKQAVKNSIPLPLPPSQLSVPRKIEFTIQYMLQ